jgi:hypothetical protein
MKKSLFILAGLMFTTFVFQAQETNTTTPAGNNTEQKQAEFDKKFRFGLKITPQTVWLKSNNTNSSGSGIGMGFGFGLMMDIKLSDIIRFSTGIGGEFDGGWVKYRYVTGSANPADDFNVNVVMNNENTLVEAKDGLKNSEYDLVNGNTQYILNDRKYRATFVNIPLLLKMMTQEYSGMRYFFNFGGELGIRAGLKANDSYAGGVTAKAGTGGAITTSTVGATEVKNINVGKDGSLIPMRVGMNLGFGVEYRLGGSTALLVSANYFHSFTNLMRNESKFLTKGLDNKYDAANGWNFAGLNQGYFARAVRLNIGLMF